jgi:hypothetical protein
MKQSLYNQINNIRLVLVVLIFINALLLWNNNINLRNGLRLSSQSSAAVLEFQQNNNTLHNLSLQHIDDPTAFNRIGYHNLKSNKFKKQIDQIKDLPAVQKDLLLKAYSHSRNLMTLQVKAMDDKSSLLLVNNLQYQNYQSELENHLKQFTTLLEINNTQLIEVKVWFSIAYVLILCFFSLILLFIVNLSVEEDWLEKITREN